MKLKILILGLIILICSPVFLYAVTEQELEAQGCVFGKAVSFDEEEAKANALKNLLESIAITVESSFEKTTTQTEKNAYNEEAKSLLKTYAFEPSLEGVKTFLGPRNKQGEFVCFRYIKKNDLDKMYSGRKKQIESFCKKSQDYEKESNYQDALKFYYYALVLLKTVPLKYLNKEEKELTLSISDQIKKIIENTTFELVNIQSDTGGQSDYILKVQTFKKDVSKLQISYWDGNRNVYADAKDGRVVLTFFGKKEIQPTETTITTNYQYYQDSKMFDNVKAAWGYANKSIPLLGASAKVSLLKKKKGVLSSFISKETNSYNSVLVLTEEVVCKEKDECPEAEVKNKITIETNKLIEFIKNKKTDDIANFTTDEFIKNKISSILKNNNTKPIIDKNDPLLIRKQGKGWELRKIPVVNNYDSMRLKTTDSLVLDFSEKGELNDINFTVNKELYDTFEKNSKMVDNWKQTQVLIKFLEKYRTAYLARDIDTINKIFSDKALIIVGRLIKKDEVKDVNSYRYKKIGEEQPDVEYLRFTKKDYVQRQAQIFKQTKDIHIGFSTFNILKKDGDSNIYELSMKQYYKSSTYSDEGYLFLLVDFKREETPKIYVRAWQPREWNEANLLTMDNFEVCELSKADSL